MENKWMRFLSLLLALVMVIALVPFGQFHVHAEESTKPVMSLVDMEPDVPEAGKSYVMCFLLNGNYYALTSNATTCNNGANGCLATERAAFSVATSNNVWKLIVAEGGYLLEASDGRRLSLNGEHNYDAFLAPHPTNSNIKEEVMQLVPVAGTAGYHIKNPSGRFVNALGGASNFWYQFGSWSTGDTVYFFEVQYEKEVTLKLNENFEVTISGDYSEVTGNEIVEAEAVYTPETIKKITATSVSEITDGQYILYNTRALHELTNQDQDSNDRLNRGDGVLDMNNVNEVWTITAVTGGYTIQDSNEKYLHIDDASSKLQDTAPETPLTISFDTDIENTAMRGWEIGQGIQLLNDHSSTGDFGGWAGNNSHKDEGSQWELYKIVDVPVYNYTVDNTVVDSFDGGMYYLVNKQNNGSLTAHHRRVTSSGASGIGLTSVARNQGVSYNNGWIITEKATTNNEDGTKTVSATVKNAFGSYLTVGRNMSGNGANGWAHLSDSETTVNLTYVSTRESYTPYWTITQTQANNQAYFLNKYGDGFGAWYPGDEVGRNPATTGDGNIWYAYPVTAVPVGTTTVTFTALKAGDTKITVGDTTYSIHVHNGVIEGTVKPTLCEPGHTGKTVCADCGEVLSAGEVISQLPVAAVLNDSEVTNNAISTVGTVVALNDCEYIYTKTGENTGKFAHKIGETNYYVKPAADNNHARVPHTISETAVTLHWGTGDNAGKVQISGNGGLHFWHDRTKPWWDRCDTGSGEDSDWAGHGLYLFLANGTTEGDVFPGYTQITSATQMEDGGSYLIAAKNDDSYGARWFVMHPSENVGDDDYAYYHIAEYTGTKKVGHNWNAGTCTNGCGTTWDFLANMTLGNDLKVHFAFEKALMTDWTGCYAVIEKGNETKTIPMGEWTDTGIKGTDYYYVTFDGVAAKEMTDEFTVTIYNAENQPISTVYTDSVKGYAHRVLNGNYPDDYKTVMVDMLNYGAEAQTYFGYNIDKLANADLTDDQKALATQTVSYQNNLVKPEGIEYLANVKLESNIQFLMAFTGINPDTMTATVTFTDWNGVEHTVTPAFTESGRFHYIIIEDTVIADGFKTITCTIKNGDTVVATVTDSIASYAARAESADAENANLYKAMMKFSTSTLAYLAN